MKTIIFCFIYVNSFCCMIMASELSPDKSLDIMSMPLLSMNDSEIGYVKQKLPYLQGLVNNSINIIEQYDYLRQQFTQNEQLDRLKEIKRRLDEVDQHQNPVITQSLDGQVRVLYWLVECSYIHNQLKQYMQKTL